MQKSFCNPWNAMIYSSRVEFETATNAVTRARFGSKVYKSKKRERKNENLTTIPTLASSQTSSPSSLAETALPLGTARRNGADPDRCFLHSCFLRSAFHCHASSSGHGTGALEDGSGTWTQHTTRAIFLLAPDHSPSVAG
jgi:hypothetical protein